MTCSWTIEDTVKGLEGMILSTKFIEHDFNGIVNIEACEQAIDLLKALEPRVMTLEEVVSAECVWIEYAVSGNVVIAFPWDIELTDDTYNFICNPNCIVEFKSLYGEEWRCWTSRPTDEQRKATPWEPPKEEGTWKS